MVAASKKQKQQLSLFAGLSRSERRRGVIVTVGLTTMFVAAILVSTSSYFSPDHQSNSVISKLTPLPASPGGEAAHREAAIVIETDKRGTARSATSTIAAARSFRRGSSIARHGSEMNATSRRRTI